MRGSFVVLPRAGRGVERDRSDADRRRRPTRGSRGALPSQGRADRRRGVRRHEGGCRVRTDRPEGTPGAGRDDRRGLLGERAGHHAGPCTRNARSSRRTPAELCSTGRRRADASASVRSLLHIHGGHRRPECVGSTGAHDRHRSRVHPVHVGVHRRAEGRDADPSARLDVRRVVRLDDRIGSRTIASRATRRSTSTFRSSTCTWRHAVAPRWPWSPR